MGAPTTFEHLPLETIECISNHLSATELSRCCSVSRTWRQIFSNDIFWKRHFNKVLGNDLKTADCQVSPKFLVPLVENSSLSPIGDGRLNYMREIHLWKNWRSGSFIREEIEFDCDDTISYNIKVDFVGNNHVFLHTTFQTEVWDVTQKPCLKMTIPFRLNEMWEENLYKVIGNKLVVVQCNVVQIFDFYLDTNSFSLSCAFFFNFPQEFSSKITTDTNIDDMFQESSFSVAEDVVRVVSGDYFVGLVTQEDDLQKPIIHIWNIKTGKKVKEETCPVLDMPTRDISLKISETMPQQILVSFETVQNRVIGYYVSVYDLNKLQFINSSQYYHLGDAMLWGRFLCTLHDSKLEIIHYENNNKKLKEYNLRHPYSMQVLDNNLIVGSCEAVFQLNLPDNQLSLKPMETKFELDFTFSDLNPIYNRFIAVHDMECNVREIWEIGKPSMKVLSFPEDTGTYRAVNESCTRIVLERANKLIVLSFW